MGTGDSIRNAAENALKDLGGTAEPHDDGHVPEPGAPDEEIKVHSSISEASRTRDAEEDERGGAPVGGPGGNIFSGGSGAGMAGSSQGPAGAGQSGTADTPEGAAAPGRSVPGPGGLPDSDPDVLRAGPREVGRNGSTRDNWLSVKT